MAFFSGWRRNRQRQQSAATYVAVLLREPADADVAWLSGAATRGDDDHARWELRYARRAIGLLVAQRDALDDRTASLVAETLSTAFQTDERIDPARFSLVERQYNARVAAFRDALAARAPDGSIRLGQTLLAFAGGSFRDLDDTVRRAGEIMGAFEREANEALRAAFGTAVLPEHVPPSALASQVSAGTK